MIERLGMMAGTLVGREFEREVVGEPAASRDRLARVDRETRPAPAEDREQGPVPPEGKIPGQPLRLDRIGVVLVVERILDQRLGQPPAAPVPDLGKQADVDPHAGPPCRSGRGIGRGHR